MGKINGCLKRLFITFNAIFVGFGFLMIIGVMKATTYSNQLSAVGGPSLGWSWLFAIGFLSISCLGLYAGSSEKPLALKIFAGCMGIGMVIMLIFGILVFNERNKIRPAFLETSSELTKHIMAEKEMTDLLKNIQQQMQCCGLVSAEDWGDRIPDSCQCQEYKCKSKPQGTTGPDQIHQQTCGEFMYSAMSPIFEIAIGFCFLFAVIAFLGLLISLLMIHQVNCGGSRGIEMNSY
ncbi:hypothetical protein Q5P01_003813 [Channa striata]|uniref:Tetraspanin n=1 Tax=Channa striata TaxID=64152 RepID=A0AA88NLI9_CHASR|nr:hypothetical protein Q5P01_003813 [Channa striata]